MGQTEIDWKYPSRVRRPKVLVGCGKMAKIKGVGVAHTLATYGGMPAGSV